LNQPRYFQLFTLQLSTNYPLLKPGFETVPRQGNWCARQRAPLSDDEGKARGESRALGGRMVRHVYLDVAEDAGARRVYHPEGASGQVKRRGNICSMSADGRRPPFSGPESGELTPFGPVCFCGVAKSSIGEQETVCDDFAFEGLPTHLEPAQHRATAGDEYFPLEEAVWDRHVADQVARPFRSSMLSTT